MTERKKNEMVLGDLMTFQYVKGGSDKPVLLSTVIFSEPRGRRGDSLPKSVRKRMPLNATQH